MAGKSLRDRAGVLLMAISAAWMAATIYIGFIDVDPDQYGFRSPDVEQRMMSCTGSFQRRYECKESIIISKGHQSFLIWVEKVALVFAPPLVLAGLFGLRRRKQRSKGRDEYDRVPPPVSKWRVR